MLGTGIDAVVRISRQTFSVAEGVRRGRVRRHVNHVEGAEERMDRVVLAHVWSENIRTFML